jgi:outer membrane protein, heavy metal efflux system
MKKILLLSLALALSNAFALSLQDALAKVPQTVSVKQARTEAADAKTNLERQLSDPLLTKPTELQARQRNELAQLQLTAAQRSAEANVVNAYTQALEAQKQVQIAEKGVDLRELSLNIAQIRQRNGSGTAFDVKDAQNQLEDAKKNLVSAKDGLSTALKSLQNIIGAFDNKVSVPQLAQLPAMVDVKMTETVVNRSTNVARARQGLEQAKQQVALLDPSYSAQSQIDAAKTQAENAADSLDSAQDNERLSVTNLFNQLVTARTGLGVQEAAENNAQDRLATDQKRLKAGLISQLQLTQTELSTLQAELGVVQARSTYLKAYYGFLAGSGGAGGAGGRG